MKLTCHRDDGIGGAAFTLPEVMVAMTLFLMVLAAVVTSNLFGVRMLEVNQPKLDADVQARRLIARVVEEVRSVSNARVGVGDENTFSSFMPGVLRSGNALQLWETNAAVFVRYYRDAASEQLMRVASGGWPEVIVGGVTNEQVFTAENFLGIIQTSDPETVVIGVTLRFGTVGQGATVGPDHLIKGHELRLKATPRER